MKEIFRAIRGYKNYKVSNFGRIQNTKTGKFLKGWNNQFDRNYVSFSVDGKSSTAKMRAKIVLEHFKPKELDKDYAVHINSNLFDHTVPNLKWGTMGDVKRMFKTIRNERRGVYKFRYGNKNWRAILKVNGKSKTIGYFKERHEAENAFVLEYIREYGYAPYTTN